MEDKNCPIRNGCCRDDCALKIHDECAIHVIGRHFLDVTIGDIPDEYYVSHNKMWESTNVNQQSIPQITITEEELREHLSGMNQGKFF